MPRHNKRTVKKVILKIAEMLALLAFEIVLIWIVFTIILCCYIGHIHVIPIFMGMNIWILKEMRDCILSFNNPIITGERLPGAERQLLDADGKEISRE